MSEYMPRPCMYLSRPSSGSPIARLSFCELIYLLTVIDAATLYLLIECNAVESHVRADRLCKWAVMFVRLWNDAFAISKMMAHLMGHSIVFGEVSDYGAVLTPAAPLPCDLGLLLHREGLRP